MDELDVRLLLCVINLTITFVNIFMIAKMQYGWKKMYYDNKDENMRYFSKYCKEIDKNFDLQVEIFDLKGRLKALGQINDISNQFNEARKE